MHVHWSTMVLQVPYGPYQVFRPDVPALRGRLLNSDDIFQVLLRLQAVYGSVGEGHWEQEYQNQER
jgi:hypothetical protein